MKTTDAGKQTASAKPSLRITAALAISTGALPGGTTGVPYSSALAATGGTAPYQWSITSGALPGGLALSESGLISGTPTATTRVVSSKPR